MPFPFTAIPSEGRGMAVTVDEPISPHSRKEDAGVPGILWIVVSGFVET